MLYIVALKLKHIMWKTLISLLVFSQRQSSRQIFCVVSSRLVPSHINTTWNHARVCVKFQLRRHRPRMSSAPQRYLSGCSDVRAQTHRSHQKDRLPPAYGRLRFYIHLWWNHIHCAAHQVQIKPTLEPRRSHWCSESLAFSIENDSPS